MKSNERALFLAEIARRKPNLGKTAIMKITYLLQTVFEVPFGYDYEIYTYGPYCQSVMSDLELAEHQKYLEIAPVQYENGMRGYSIRSEDIIGEKSDDLDIAPYVQALEHVIAFSQDLTAKELELYSTIVFVCRSYAESGWPILREDICLQVQGIKPHFEIGVIWSAYDKLQEERFI